METGEPAMQEAGGDDQEQPKKLKAPNIPVGDQNRPEIMISNK